MGFQIISQYLILTCFCFLSCEYSDCEPSFTGVNSEIHEVKSSIEQVESLKGKWTDFELFSKSLNETRKISVYEPKDYDSSSNYGVLIVTDGMGDYLVKPLEYLIEESQINPILMISIDNRWKRDIDSIFNPYIIDFRELEFFKGIEVGCINKEDLPLNKSSEKDFTTFNKLSDIPTLANDSTVLSLVSNRYERFSVFISSELIPYLRTEYQLTEDKNNWTIGGLSNGGAFVYSFSCDFPDLFGNAIVMSPAGPSDNYNFNESTSNYLIAAGTNDPFYGESVRYLHKFDEFNIPYIHYTYDAGHDRQMWITFYLEAIKMIYCKGD